MFGQSKSISELCKEDPAIVITSNSLSPLDIQFVKQVRQHLVIVDEFDYIPFSKTGSELLFKFFSERYKRGSIMVTPICCLISGPTCWAANS